MLRIFNDIKTAVKLTREVREARKNGANALQVKPVYSVPLVDSKPAYFNTIEGCLSCKCSREADRAVSEVFRNLPYDVQRQLEFTPDKPGGWVKRACLWQRQLKPALPPKMFHHVMLTFIHWYAHCLRARLA